MILIAKNKIVLADGKVLHLSELSGKLEDFFSLSTSVWNNSYCQKRMKIPGSICEECYAYNSWRKKTMIKPLTENMNILSSKLYEVEDFPEIPHKVLRLESHGEISNLTHARNYIRLAKRNPDCVFTIWTKNYGILNQAIQLEGKPENMITGCSSLFKNTPYKPRYSWVDFVFTVFDADYVKENDTTINCPRKCKTCMKCYTLENFKNKTEPLYIREILKSDASKVKVEGDE